MKNKNQRSRGAPRGNRYAAKPADERRVVVNLAVARETRSAIRELAEKKHMSMGRVLDAAVAALRESEG